MSMSQFIYSHPNLPSQRRVWESAPFTSIRNVILSHLPFSHRLMPFMQNFHSVMQ